MMSDARWAIGVECMGSKRKAWQRDRCARDEQMDGLEEMVEGRGDASADVWIDGASVSDGRANAKSDRKNAQMAKAARRVLEREIGSRDSAISWGMSVVDVEVLGRGTHIRVVVVARSQEQPRVMRDWLAGQEASLRYALAQSLARKRVPGLSLELIEGLVDRCEVESEGDTYEA
jgi:ribosome-binding factor A